MANEIIIGEILKPQGIRGELKMKNFTDGFFAIKGLKNVIIDGVRYQVLKMREDKGAILLLKGIADRNVAELFRGKSVYADKDEISREENTYFISDVIGCRVVLSDGTSAGEITDVMPAKVDIYYINNPELGKAIFPLIPALEPIFDIENRTLTVNKEVFLREVKSFEN